MPANGTANLKPCRKGETHNPNGRPPLLSKALRTIPRDAQEQIYGILHYALTMPSVAEARKYIEDQAKTEMRYGFVLQIAIKSLMGKNGMTALNDILDRLFGRPRQTNIIGTTGEATVIVVRNEDEKQKLDNIGNLGV